MTQTAHVKTPNIRKPSDIPSDAKRKTKRQKFCPYCEEYRRFKAHKRDHEDGTKTVGYKRCTGCGISVEDYYVKHVNADWDISLKPTGKKRGR